MRFRLAIFLLLAATLASRAASLEFTGLQSFTSKGLLEAVGGRLDYIRDRPATPSRADDAAYLIEAYLHAHGLPDALVSGRLVSDRRIRLIVEEGIAQFLGPVTVTGAENPAAIIEQFSAPFLETGDRRAFEADAIETGLARVRELLHTDGYWEGRVTASKGQRLENGEIPFQLEIERGPQFTLSTPRINSRVAPIAELQEAMTEVAGKPATAENIIAARGKVSENYRRRGYPEISISMLKETRDGTLQLTFQVTPGEKFTVHSFETEGLEKTQTNYIRSRFNSLVGETYDEESVNAEIKKLLATGAFSGVRLEKTVRDQTELDLTLHLTEAEARGYSVAVGYGSIEGYILGLRYFDRNLWGRLWNLSAGAELTSLGGLGEVSLTNPYFLERDLRLASRAFLLSRDFDNYRKVEGGLGTELSWKWGDHYTGTLGLTLSQSSVNSSLPRELVGSENYFVSRLSYRQLYDRRDDPALPSDGWFASLETAIGLSVGDESIGFFEIEGQASYYRTLGDDTSYAIGLRAGAIEPTGSTTNLPIDLRRFLGGANTIRSFPELEMGPSFNNRALGGTEWWLANVEYMHTIVGPLRGLVFVDAGGLDSEVDVAAGVGLRVNLPVGPIRLEYGRSLTRDRGEPGGAFHFAIGTTF